MKLKLLFILMLSLAMALISCNTHKYKYTQIPPPGYTLRTKPVWVDKTFSPQDKAVIEDAVGQWNHVLNGTVVLKIVSYQFDMEIETLYQASREKGLLIMRVESDNYMVGDPTTGAWVNELGGGRLYVVKDKVSTDMLKGIMLHELGHVMGASHQEGNTLMFERYNTLKFTCIDQATVKQVSTYQLINLNHLNYCFYE